MSRHGLVTLKQIIEQTESYRMSVEKLKAVSQETAFFFVQTPPQKGKNTGIRNVLMIQNSRLSHTPTLIKSRNR